MVTPTFEEQGFALERGLLTPDQCRQFIQELEAGQPAPLDWAKGGAATSRLFYEAATLGPVLSRVKGLLGGDVVLWGASVVPSPAGHVHPPHVDIETSTAESRAISVWIGLEHTSRDATLQLIAGSHRVGKPVQQVAREHGTRRGRYSVDDALRWAAATVSGVSLVTPDVHDGDAVFFDGRLWHGSHNHTALLRRALLLQFSAAGLPIRIPDLSVLDWPFSSHEQPRPPCVVVAGESDGSINRVVPPPRPRSNQPFLSAVIRRLPEEPGHDHDGFTPHHQFAGVSANVTRISCHVSFLDPGTTPHPPHRHEEEELLIVLGGSASLVWEQAVGERVVPVQPGAVAYYPAGHAHTIRAEGDSAARYLMFKWVGPQVDRRGDPQDAAVHRLEDVDPRGEGGFRVAGLFNGRTAYLHDLHSHVSELDPDAGYAPHVDSHDVAIVLVEGEVETIGGRLAAPGVVFSAGGEPLDMRNVGEGVARYVVFEFHGPGRRSFPSTELRPSDAAAHREPPAPPVPETERATPAEPDHTGWAAIWVRGGRALDRFPRTRRLVKRLLRPLSPW